MIPWTFDLTSLLSLHRLYEAVDPKGPPKVSMVLRSAQGERRVGILPSSFNPPTLAHLGLAETAKATLQLEQVVLSLGKVILDKKLSGLCPADRLLSLCALARRRPWASIAVPSCGLYADMAMAYQEVYPDATLIFIVGFDKAEQIFDPKYYQDKKATLTRLFSLARLAVASRGDNGRDDLEALLQKPENQAFASFVEHLPVDPALSDISSTHVRELAQRGESSPEEVPEEVALLLRDTRVYQPPKGAGEDLIDAYALRVAALSLASRSETAGGDLRPVIEALCQDSLSGKNCRQRLAAGGSWEELCALCSPT